MAKRQTKDKSEWLRMLGVYYDFHFTCRAAYPITSSQQDFSILIATSHNKLYVDFIC